jgi:hypothetical protein
MNEHADPGFRSWCIVELMGHVTLAGFVSEAEIGGGKLMKIDVPPSRGAQAFTSYFGSSSVYKLTPVDEATVLAICSRAAQQPFSSWELQKAFEERLGAVKEDLKKEAREEVSRELTHQPAHPANSNPERDDGLEDGDFDDDSDRDYGDDRDDD